MPKAKRGQRLPNGTVVLQGSTSASLTQMRCPRCRSNAVGKGTDPRGRTIYGCPGCGNTFVSSSL